MKTIKVDICDSDCINWQKRHNATAIHGICKTTGKFVIEHSSVCRAKRQRPTMCKHCVFNTKVLNSRLRFLKNEQTYVIARQRECLTCGHRFATREYLEIQSNNSFEPTVKS